MCLSRARLWAGQERETALNDRQALFLPLNNVLRDISTLLVISSEHRTGHQEKILSDLDHDAQSWSSITSAGGTNYSYRSALQTSTRNVLGQLTNCQKLRLSHVRLIKGEEEYFEILLFRCFVP